MEIDLSNLPKSKELLEEFIHSLHATLQRTQDELRFSKSKLEVSQTELETSQKELSSYKDKYFQLLEILRLEKQRRFSNSSEKNLLQPDLFDEPGIKLSDEVKAQIEEEVEVTSYVRKKHPVRSALPKDLPRERIVHDISEEEKVCSCGSHLVCIGEEITEQLKYIPAQLSVVQHVRPKYACKPCQSNVKIAAMPILLLPKSIATAELVAHTIITKYSDHIPLYRQESIWKRLKIELPRSSLCGWVLKTAELCEPLVKLLRKRIIEYDYAQADETRVQVLGESNRNNTTNSFMWCYRGGKAEQPSIVFEYQETRAGYHAKGFFEGFKGYLQSDAYSGYHWVINDKGIISLGCMAHARRPFAELSKLSKKAGLATEGIKFIGKLYAIEKVAREQKLSASQRYELRNQHSKAILDAFKEWLEHHQTKVPVQHKIGKAIQYCLRHWTELTAYLKDGRLEIDNNQIENVIRPFALGRKNWIFNGSPAGAKASAILYSLIETCKANDIEPYQYFCTMLNKIRHCRSEEDYQKLLPQSIQL